VIYFARFSVSCVWITRRTKWKATTRGLDA
jgi:hypothetical protein